MRIPAILALWTLLSAPVFNLHAESPASLPAVGIEHPPEIRWTVLYASARRRAAAENRPLLLRFSTSNCPWCLKLEKTFEDAAVIALVNERFVPLKVYAPNHPELTQACGVQSFPVLIVADPKGKILATIDGYRDPVKLGDELRQALRR